MWNRAFFVLCLAALYASGCECPNFEPFKACQIYRQTPVIFRGRFIDHDPDRTLYRMKVLEGFKGLAPGTKEVFIDPGSLGDCYRSDLVLDRDYLIYTHDAYEMNGHFPIYLVMNCNPSRTIDANDPDLDYLRAAAKGALPTYGSIEGRAVQNYEPESYFRLGDYVPVSDAILTATSASGERRQIAVQPEGFFRMSRLDPRP